MLEVKPTASKSICMWLHRRHDSFELPSAWAYCFATRYLVKA